MEQQQLLRTIAQNVSHYRKAAQLTQEALAERAGLTPGTISKLECGTLSVKTATLYGLAEALHVTCDALLYPRASSPAVHSIEHLLEGQSPEMIADIEHIVRYCVTHFSSRPLPDDAG